MAPAVLLWDFGDTLVDERWMLRAPRPVLADRMVCLAFPASHPVKDRPYRWFAAPYLRLRTSAPHFVSHSGTVAMSARSSG